MKYVNTEVTLREYPNEITLCINISNCPCKCKGCHSAYLAEDIGDELNAQSIRSLISNNEGITCIGLMGGDADQVSINRLARFIKSQGLKVGWYSGRDYLDLKNIDVSNFDYIKIGSYKQDRGGLDSIKTNQIFFRVHNYTLYPETYKFNYENSSDK